MDKINFTNRSFIKSIVVLGGGTALAQAIPALTSPILTRLYSPEDFGLWAIFLAMTYAILPVVSGKYEIAMATVKEQKEVCLLYEVSLWVTVVVSSLGYLLLLEYAEEILNLLDKKNLGDWVFAIPFLLCLLGIFNILSYVANSQKKYALISKNKIIQAVVTAMVTIGMGLLGSGFIGYVIGYVFGTLLANIHGMHRLKIDIRLLSLLEFSKDKKNIAFKYKDFPLFNASSSLLSGFQQRIPFFFIAPYFSDAILGNYMLMFQVAFAPLSFVAFSISQVNLKKVVELIHSGENITRYLFKLTGVLLMIGLIPTLVSVFYAPQIFTVIFGKQWSQAGTYLQILMPAFAIQFIVSTLSSTLDATQHNKLGALWKVLAFISTLSVFMVIAPRKDFESLLYANLINTSVIYLLYYFIIIYAASHVKKYA
ncbi:MAG: oligosaccharide flippase family protein [Methylococcaceae bacterium]|nr:oligosaccharide flippase family protein [Methylococcaceae bacterium]